MLVSMNKTSALCLHTKEKFDININWSRKEERAAIALVVLLIRNGLEMEFWLWFGIWAREYLIFPSSFFPALIWKKKSPLALGECVQLVAAKFRYRKFFEALVLDILKRARGNKALCV